MSRAHSREPRRNVALCALLTCLAASAWGANPKLAVTITSDTHPSLVNDFEQNLEPFVARPVIGTDAPSDLPNAEPPTVSLSRVDEPGRGSVLKMTNAVSGGFVGTWLFRGNVMPVFSHLSFDYACDPSLKVNLFARAFDQYEIGFTAPPAQNAIDTWLGRVPGVQPDGQWHSLDIPLLRLLRGDQPVRNPLRLSELCFENRYQGDYLLAGFGGNPAGASMKLAHFVLERVGGPSARLAWAAADTEAVAGYAVAVDRAKATVPPEQPLVKELERSLENLAEGYHWVHVRAKGKDGTWGDTAHFRLAVNLTPPTATLLDPAPGSNACPAVWRVKLAGHNGIGVAPATIKVVVNGNRAEELGCNSAGIEYSPVDELLSVNLGRLATKFANRSKPTIEVSAADENGLAMPAPFVASFNMRHELDKSAPTGLKLAFRVPGAETAEDLQGNGTFEEGTDEWERYAVERVIVERTEATAAAGKASLRVLNTVDGGNFAVHVRRSEFDVARFKVVSFDYKASSRLRVGFSLQVDMKPDVKWCRIKFCDRSRDGKLIGEVPDVVQDDQWHHAEFNLYDMLRAAWPNAPGYRVTQFLLTGGITPDSRQRFPGNYAGVEYNLDNFFLVPTLTGDARLEWSAEDAVGVAGAEVAVAPELAGLAKAAPKRCAGNGVAVSELGNGALYAQVRAFDAAGNLSTPRVVRLNVSGGRPEVLGSWPAAGVSAAPATIGVGFKPDRMNGIDPTSLKLRLTWPENGKEVAHDYEVDQRVLSFDAWSGRLVWDGRRAEDPVPLPDKSVIKVQLVDARDQAGNRPKVMPAWQFTMDYALDKTGPTVLVKSKTHSAFFQDNFESETLGWRPDPAREAVLKRVPDEREPQTYALAVSATTDKAAYVAWCPLDPVYSTVRFSHLAFDYNIPKGAGADLLLRLSGDGAKETTLPLGLTERPGVPRRLKVPGIIADGQWHQAVVPLAQLLKGEEGLPQAPVVPAIGFGDAGPTGATAGTTLRLANVSIFRPSTTNAARVTWQALDESGVKAYSFVVDQDPRTVPPTTATSDASKVDSSFPGLPAGRSWFHIRALDGAGNWGPTTHFLLMCPDK